MSTLSPSHNEVLITLSKTIFSSVLWLSTNSDCHFVSVITKWFVTWWMFSSLCSLHGWFSLRVIFTPSGEAESHQHPVAPAYPWGRRLHSRVSHAKSPCLNKNYVQNSAQARLYSLNFYCERECVCVWRSGNNLRGCSSAPILFEPGSLVAHCYTSQSSWPVSFWGLSCLHLPLYHKHKGITDPCCLAELLYGSQGPNAGSHVPTAST